MEPTMSRKVMSAFFFPEVRVVEASAGSGKTYTLAKRYVQLLLCQDFSKAGIPTQNILALTFTNKAAFEMKERILYFLKGIALGQLSKVDLDNILTPLGITQKEAEQRAFFIMESIIHHYHFFQVQTIDKFINSLLSGCSFKVGLTANFKIKTNAFEYLEYSLDRLIDQAAFDQDALRLFERFLDNYLYIENRKGWFPKKDILTVVKALYDQSNVYGFAYEQSPYSIKQLNDLKHGTLEHIKSLSEMLPEKIFAPFRKSIEKFVKEYDYIFDIDQVPNFAREEPPLNKGGVASDEFYALWSIIRENLRKVCLYEAYSLYNPYIEVFQQVMTTFYQQSAKDDVLFLEELNKKARNLFDEQGVTVEELYFRLATRIEHYLIDEFQDTSRLQWSNIKLLPEEALSTGGTLFYVGDRKQAIYGFRGGDITLFNEIMEEFQEFVRSESLINNFRSHKTIVAFNNAVFSKNNLNRFIQLKESNEEAPVKFQGEDYRRLAAIFESSEQTHRPDFDKGYVRMEAIDAGGKAENEELTRGKVIDLIKDLRKRFELREIAILTRNNVQVEIVTNWLLEENIAVDSERTSNVKDNQRVQEIIALLKFLNSPIDNISFALFILGDVFTKATGCDLEEVRSFIFKFRSNLAKQANFYLYQAFRKEYPEVWEKYFEEFYKNIGLFPLYELVISIYEKFRCLENFYADQGYFMLFLELIKKREEEHSDVASFFDYFDNLTGESLYVQLTGLNAVRIMTIHKSKGLEFPVVIIPFLVMDINVGARSNETGQSYVLRQGKEHLRLLRLKKKYCEYSDELYQIYREEYIRSLFTELNNVYVALTRASHELYGFIPKKVRQSYNPANFLIPQEIYELGSPADVPKKEKAGLAWPLPLERARHQNWIDYLNDEFMAYQKADTYHARLQGTIMHYILANIGNIHGKNMEAEVQRAMDKAENEFGKLDESAVYKAKAREILTHSDIKKLFQIDSGSVFTEKEVVDRFGNTKRIDRIVLKKNEIWIVDYKSTATEPEKDAEQILSYKATLTSIYSGQAVKCFLVYLDPVSLKEIDE